MDKFLEWMASKGRLSEHKISSLAADDIVISEVGVIYKGITGTYFDLPKQVLIGYMVEYLFQFRNDDLHEMVEWSVIEDIDKLYSNLESMINEL